MLKEYHVKRKVLRKNNNIYVMSVPEVNGENCLTNISLTKAARELIFSPLESGYSGVQGHRIFNRFAFYQGS